MYVVSYKERDADIWQDLSWHSKSMALLFAAELLNSGFVVFMTQLEV